MRGISSWLCVVCCAAVCLCGAVGCAPQSVTRNGFALNTPVSITVYGTRDQGILDACFDLIAQKERLFSRTVPQSDIGRINAAKGEATEVSAETAELLRRALYWSEVTDGAFDVTVAPYVELWDFTADTPQLPASDALQRAGESVGWRGVTVQGNVVTLAHPDAAVDLGGIAKGYIADCLYTYLQQRGYAALIDLGGSITAVGDKNGAPFRIGVQHPRREDALIGYTEIQGASVVTSGDYQRYFMLDGVRYHHILDPADGMPAQTDLCSVTVVGACAADADALATACIVLGKQKAQALLRELGAAAVLVMQDGTVWHTDGLQWTAK